MAVESYGIYQNVPDVQGLVRVTKNFGKIPYGLLEFTLFFYVQADDHGNCDSVQMKFFVWPTSVQPYHVFKGKIS